MKPNNLSKTLFLASFGMVLFVTVLMVSIFRSSPKKPESPSASNVTKVSNSNSNSLDPMDLLPYVLHIQGEWVTEAEASGSEDDPMVRISINPMDITRDEIKVVISEYCQPGYAEYLHFKLRGDSLEYIGASADLCAFDIPVIDYMYLYFEEEKNETILHYAAGETEYEDHVDMRMVRIAEPFQGYGWRCGLQPYLADLLRNKTYELRDSNGNILDKNHHLSSEEMLESLTFFERYTSLWPAYEEKCILSEMDIVVLGDYREGEPMKTYAIEWKRGKIELYDTFLPFESTAQEYRLKKGELAYILIPTSGKSNQNPL